LKAHDTHGIIDVARVELRHRVPLDVINVGGGWVGREGGGVLVSLDVELSVGDFGVDEDLLDLRQALHFCVGLHLRLAGK
jgi:hypothetical protein